MTGMTEVPSQDLLGKPLTDRERELAELYIKLKTLSAAEDLPPCALMNVRQAMVMLWNTCVDLNLVYEEPGVD